MTKKWLVKNLYKKINNKRKTKWEEFKQGILFKNISRMTIKLNEMTSRWLIDFVIAKYG